MFFFFLLVCLLNSGSRQQRTESIEGLGQGENGRGTESAADTAARRRAALSPTVLPRSEKSLPEFGTRCLYSAHQVPRRVKLLDHGVRVKFAAVLAERNRRREPARAEVVPRRIEPKRDTDAAELLMPDPLPFSMGNASNSGGITLLDKIRVLEEGH